MQKQFKQWMLLAAFVPTFAMAQSLQSQAAPDVSAAATAAPDPAKQAAIKDLLDAIDAQKLVGDLTGNGPVTQTEMASLTKKFGPDNVASFEKTFDYVITDSLAQATTAGVALPATPLPDPADGRALASALYTAGVAPHGGYDVEYMLDSLVSHVIHVAVMNDIDANPDLGPKADANYHAVLAQTMLDLKNAYKLEQ